MDRNSGNLEAENHSFCGCLFGKNSFKNFYLPTALWMSTDCGIFEAKLWHAVDLKKCPQFSCGAGFCGCVPAYLYNIAAVFVHIVFYFLAKLRSKFLIALSISYYIIETINSQHKNTMFFFFAE